MCGVVDLWGVVDVCGFVTCVFECVVCVTLGAGAAAASVLLRLQC